MRGVDLVAVPDLDSDFEPDQLGRAADVPPRNELVAGIYFYHFAENRQPVKPLVCGASISHAENLRRVLLEEYNRRNDLPRTTNPCDAARCPLRFPVLNPERRYGFPKEIGMGVFATFVPDDSP